jgi:alkanesulfonate monooxygenase SsuD/methylene tetrahydromethanopterin reductase-like flavin-dependent oxidoreductase (luciferase family)
MEFGYFTLSDNHYENNPRSANQFVEDITAEALYADQIGMHSAWIGEHHFNSLGVLSCPDLVLAYIAARTRHIRLAPAVTVLPLHHPIRVAEQWASLDLLSNGRVDFAAGRGYDKREYLPFHVSFENNQSIFDEGLELVRKLWQADGRMSYHGKHYQFDDVRITPKPVQKPIPTYDRCAVRRRHELWRPQASGRPLSRELREIRQQAAAADVQLFRAFCRQQGPGRRPARPANSLLQGMRDPGVPGGSEDGAAELSLFHRYR